MKYRHGIFCRVFFAFMAGRIVTKPQKVADMYPVVNDEKLRLSLISMADRWNEYVRGLIYETYNDPQLLSLYKNARDTGVYQKGWKDKSHRQIMSFPNAYIYEFCKTIFEPMYGKGWELNPKVLRHELIRPWLLVNLK